LDRFRIDTIFYSGGKIADINRRARQASFQRLELTLLIHGSLEKSNTGRSVKVMLKVFFSRPNELDRKPCGFGCLGCLKEYVKLFATPKTTANKGGMNSDFFLGVVYNRCDPFGNLTSDLRWAPNLNPICTHIHCCIHWLHGRVRQVRHLVLGFDYVFTVF